MPSTITASELAAKAAELAGAGGPGGSNSVVEALISAAGGDRQVIEAARDQVAARLHQQVADWEATATLTVLNRVLSTLPRNDPLDWRVRWARHRKP